MSDYVIIIPGMTALLVFFIYYLSKPRLPINQNRVFLAILAAEFLCMTSETAVVMLNSDYIRTMNLHLLSFLNITFFTFYICRSYLFFLFTCIITKTRLSAVKKWITRIPMLITSVIIISSFWNGAVFSLSEKRGFRTGPLFPAVLICVILYALISFGLITVKRKNHTRFEWASCTAYNAVLVCGALGRFFWPLHPALSVFCFLSVIICYLSFENPDIFISDRGGVFNKRALRAVLDESIHNGSYRALGFVLRGYIDERAIYGSTQMDRGVELIIEYLKEKYPGHLLFYLRNGNFVIFDSEALNIYAISEELYARFQQPWRTHDVDIFLTPSFVKVGAESKIRSADALIDNMLIALEKVGSSNVYGKEMYDLDNTGEIDEQVRVKGALEYAVDNDLAEVFLQPIVKADTGDVIAAEALARIRDEEGRLISPAKFIPIAEKSGYINMLGEQVFEKVCRFVNSNAFSKTGLQFVNVNLSPIQCMRADLSTRFIEIIKKCKSYPERIHLEITEQSMGDSSIIIKQVEILKNAGFQFALDDYGSGYSNLTRLKYYPFLNVKIDMDVVRDHCENKSPFLPNLITILKQLGYTITAEGIETRSMAEEMRALGCDYLQGFYYSKPVPMEDFAMYYSRMY